MSSKITFLEVSKLDNKIMQSLFSGFLVDTAPSLLIVNHRFMLNRLITLKMSNSNLFNLLKLFLVIKND